MRSPLIVSVVLVVAAATIVSAEQPSVFGGLRVPQRDTAGRRNPYAQSFGAPLTAVPRVTPSVITPESPATPTVKCGMTLIPGDAQVDPRIAAPRPPDGPRFHARTVEPTVCR